MARKVELYETWDVAPDGDDVMVLFGAGERGRTEAAMWLEPTEARQLAEMLVAIADEVDSYERQARAS